MGWGLAESVQEKLCDSGPPEAPQRLCTPPPLLLCPWRREALPEGSAHLLFLEGLLRFLKPCQCFQTKKAEEGQNVTVVW